MLFTIIGISDDRDLHLHPDVADIISKTKSFSGGKRHHEIVASLLPVGAEWIDITVPIEDAFRQFERKQEVVVFASGDPIFYGIANTIKNRFPETQIKLYPYFNSLQTLAHRLVLPYHDMRCVSLTGRPWDKFDEALICGERLIGVLTDKVKTPAAIAHRMLEYGYDNYKMSVGELLGNRDEERFRTLSLDEAEKMDFAMPNCLILERIGLRQRPFGIPESEFALLDGRAKMITKMPVRLLSLSMLGLRDRHSFWDVGFCTGSVSIEAKLQFPHLNVTAFERRNEGEELMRVNSRRFGAPGITTVIGDFLNNDLERYPRPDAVFIGGHGGHLVEMVSEIHKVLMPGGVIVFNSVSEESSTMFAEAVERVGMRVVQSTCMTIDSFNTINVMKAE